MKQRTKHFSKSALSTVLALCMLLSCVMVGLVPTDAAVTDDEELGYNEYDLTEGQEFYFDNSVTQWSAVKLQVMKKNNGNFSGGPWNLTQISGTNYWKFTAESAWDDYTHYLFYSGTWGNDTQTVDFEGELANSNWYGDCFTPVAQTNDKYTGSFNKCVGVKDFTFTSSITTSGSGTSADPYIVPTNTSITLTASATAINSSCTVNYKFDSGNYGTTATNTITSSATNDTAFNKSVTVKATRGDYDSREETNTLYFRTVPAETLYTVSAASEDTDKGTVASASVSAGANTPAVLPTATPKYGYKFKEWTTTSNNIHITNPTYASGATVTASAAGTVTATFEPNTNMNLYIAGRFHVQTTDSSGEWTNSFDSGDWSNTGDDNINFTYHSGTTYKLETHASLKNLSDPISGYNPVFYIYDKANGKYWHCTTADTYLTSSNKSTTLTKYDSKQDDKDANLRFNDQSTDKPVTIYFDVVTGVLSYTVPDFYDVTVASVTGGSVEANPTRTIAAQTVTLTATPATGYSYTGSTVSGTGVTVSTSGNQSTFTMPARNVTVTPAFSKINYTLTSAATSNGSFTLSTQTSNPATTATYEQTVTVTCSPNAHYEVDTVKFNGVDATGSGNNWTFTMPAQNTTVTVTFKEKLYAVTVQTNDPAKGTVVRGTSTVSGGTTQIGYITAVTLVATSKSGYEFDRWTVTKGTATSMVVNGGSAISLSGSSEQTFTGNTTASSSFKLNGTATLKAYFKATDYSLSAAFTNYNGNTWNGNSVLTYDTSGNIKGSLHINDYFDVKVTLAEGYEISGNPTFESGTGFVSAAVQSGYPSTSGNVVTYRYQVTTAGNVKVKVTLKAIKPTFTGVQVKNQSFTYQNVSNNGTVNTYFKQPVVATATTTTDSFASSSITYTTKRMNDAQIATVTNPSGNVTDLAADSNIIPTTEDEYVTYKLQIVATNAPNGVTPESTTFNATIKVYFNDTQKIYFRLKNFVGNCIRENTSSNDYYDVGAQINAYNNAYDAAKRYIDPDYSYNSNTGTETYNPINSKYPAYNAGSADLTAAQDAYSSFKAAYALLRSKAKTTTVYILTKYANSDSNPIMMKVWSNGTTSDWDHFKMYHYADGTTDDGFHILNSSYVNSEMIKLSYAGRFKYNSSSYNKYLYKITYCGKIRFKVWRGTVAGDTQMDTDETLTNNVENATDFKDYYINAYDTTVGATSISSVVDYADFDHTVSPGKKYVDINQSKTRTEIQNMFNFTPTSSLIKTDGVDSPGISTENVAFTIKGPGSEETEYNLLTEDFPADKQGKYTVSYTTEYGQNQNGTAIRKTKTATLWVAFDDINIYVDMNDNVGNPVLNFKYYIKNETPVAANTSGAEVTQLPYEMDLVTGSESIYKYTINISKLKNDYKVDFTSGNPIKISYIAVENYYVNTSGKHTEKPSTADLDTYAFEIGIDARISGEVWYKADSTNLTTFKPISYGSINKTFIAVAEDAQHTLLDSTIGTLHGTGINTDIDEVYNSQYASAYTIENQPAPMSNFNYVLRAAANKESRIQTGTETVNNEVRPVYQKYYFDKWVSIEAFDDEIIPVEYTDNGIVHNRITYDISGATRYSESTDLNFNSGVDYNDGMGNVLYIALYKPVSSIDTTVRVEIKYNFQDYDTSDGNYIYDSRKSTVPASYTKTVKVTLNQPYAPTSTTYTSFADVKAAINNIAGANVPHIVSNYYDYTYVANSATLSENGEITAENKLVINADLHEDAREYTIILKNGDTSSTYTGNYQNIQELPSTGISNPVWKIKQGNDWLVLGSGATGSTFNARFVSTSDSDNGTDCQLIKVEAGSSNAADHKSVVSNAYTEVYYNGETEMLSHNFYIIDYCGNTDGEFVGGGVLFATTDSNGNYRQANAATYLADDYEEDGDIVSPKTNFISGILNGDFDTEYKAQSINNVGFRYKPYKSTEDVYRYSDELGAYLTVFEGTNVNSPNYAGQKLRVFSFMVYYDSANDTNVIVPSDGYAEVDRYKNTAG